MPETRIERGVFVLGVLAIAALGFLVAHLWHSTHGVAAASTPATLSLPSPSTKKRAAAASTTATTATAAASTSTVASSTSSATGAVSLVLTAKVETWIEIRSGSARGAVLYTGMLPAGSSKTFRARSLWARFGSGANLSAHFDGKSFRLPSGTYNAAFDDRGFRKLAG